MVYRNKDPTNQGLWTSPHLSWALELECRIVWIRWLSGQGEGDVRVKGSVTLAFQRSMTFSTDT